MTERVAFLMKDLVLLGVSVYFAAAGCHKSLTREGNII
jgi:hypothetical protein